MNARVVFVSWPERPVALLDLLDCFGRAFHELREILGMVEVDERERFVRENYSSAAVNDVMDQHLALSQSITKWLDLVCNAECEVMVSQPDARAGTFLQLSEQMRDVELGTDVEVGFVER